MEELKENEQNFIKDILRTVGNDSILAVPIANALGMDINDFDNFADKVFEKLQNGRVRTGEERRD